MPREGLIPIIAGTAVTGLGAALRVTDIKRRGMPKHEVMPLVAAGILGYGLAHVVLGTIDIVEHRR